MAYTKKLTGVVKGGAASALVLYPATKLVWASDSAAKNFLPVGLPNYARTPLVTLALGAVAAALPAGYWSEKVGEMVLAAGLVQTVQQYGQTVPGTPGTIDTAVNKVFQPLANLGMKGYSERLRGYIGKRQMAGYVAQGGQAAAGMNGYTMGAAAPSGLPGRAFNPAAMHPNDNVRGNRMRGYQAEHVGR